jgi:hypothetical protein
MDIHMYIEVVVQYEGRFQRVDGYIWRWLGVGLTEQQQLIT